MFLSETLQPSASPTKLGKVSKVVSRTKASCSEKIEKKNRASVWRFQMNWLTLESIESITLDTVVKKDVDVLRDALFEVHGWRCFYSGEKMTKGVDFTIDHVWPESAGWPDCIANYLPATYDVNRSKLANFEPAEASDLIMRNRWHFAQKVLRVFKKMLREIYFTRHPSEKTDVIPTVAPNPSPGILKWMEEHLPKKCEDGSSGMGVFSTEGLTHELIDTITVDTIVPQNCEPLRQALYLAHGGLSFYDRKKLSWDSHFSVEHIRPVSYGWPDCISNYLPLWSKLNASRSNVFDPEEVADLISRNRGFYAQKTLDIFKKLLREKLTGEGLSPELVLPPKPKREKITVTRPMNADLDWLGIDTLSPDEMKNLFQTFVKHGFELSFSRDYLVALARRRYYHAKEKTTIVDSNAAYGAFFHDVHSDLGHFAPENERWRVLDANPFRRKFMAMGREISKNVYVKTEGFQTYTTLLPDTEEGWIFLIDLRSHYEYYLQKLEIGSDVDECHYSQHDELRYAEECRVQREQRLGIVNSLPANYPVRFLSAEEELEISGLLGDPTWDESFFKNVPLAG